MASKLATVWLEDGDGGRVRVLAEDGATLANEPIAYAGPNGVPAAAIEALNAAAQNLRAQFLQKTRLDDPFFRVSFTWEAPEGSPRHGQRSEAEIGLESGSDGRRLYFRDGRSITLTSEEKLGLAIVLLHDASIYTTEVRAFRESLIQQFAGPFLAEAERMRAALAQIVAGKVEG